MTEVTKSCVRVLRAERRVIQFIISILTPIWRTMVWVFGLINWCIFRSLMRWIGIPASILVFWKLFNDIPSGTVEVTAWECGLIIVIVCLGTAGAMSWIEIPEKERNILKGNDIAEAGE